MCILDLLGNPICSITLPMPPSTNRAYMPIPAKKKKDGTWSGSRVISTPEHRAWKTKVSLLEWPAMIPNRVFIVMEIQPGPDFNNSGDSDNLLKSPIDALVNNGVLVDDSKDHVAGCAGYFGSSVSRGVGRVVVRIFNEEVLNGKKPPKTLFDLSEDW